jgi:citronellyl-CoA dehydrogenase
LGHHSSDNAIVAFDNVRVPYKNIIGEPDQGFTYQMIQFQEERLAVAAGVVPSLQRLLDETIEFCKQRQTFGKPLIDNQYIHFRLAELQVEIELFKSLFYETAARFEEGDDVTYTASILKYKAGKLCREVPDTCLQYFGGLGYSADMPISRAFRDFRLMSIAGGTDEIMLGIICKFMGTLPRRPKN